MQSQTETAGAVLDAADAALRDPELARLMAARGADAPGSFDPLELVSYRLEQGTDDDEDDDSNCGSECGCNQAKGVGCGDETHGKNSGGGDCPYHKG